MARKETITINNILDAAFTMAREEGFEGVTARKLAQRAGCSTQPIFRLYRNMGELQADLYGRVIAFFDDYYEHSPRKDSKAFIDLGMAYIRFASEERNLFRMLFLSEEKGGKSMYELLNGGSGAVVREVSKAAAAGCKDPGGLFMKLWIFIHGAACMAITGDYDLGEEETRQLLTEAYQAFI